jgi:hypothetical protein
MVTILKQIRVNFVSFDQVRHSVPFISRSFSLFIILSSLLM